MVSHRVRLESAKDVNKELVDWLKQAYVKSTEMSPSDDVLREPGD
jgi:hypothetical protein